MPVQRFATPYVMLQLGACCNTELHLKRQKAARVGGGKATSQRHQVHQQVPAS
jgi:hypothetical protein